MTLDKTNSAIPRGRAAALTLDDLFLFVTAATAALPQALPPMDAHAQAAPAAAIAPAPAPSVITAPGAQARFSALIDQYDRLIRSIVSRVGRRLGLGRDNFLAREDIAQEVRFELWKQIARGQTIDYPATYIYKATIRETLRALRRHMARETVSIEESGVEEMHDAVDPFHVMAAKEQFREIILAVRCLAPDRQCAVRAHLTGFAFQEIMAMYGWSYQKARNLISRGMADLRRSLNDKGEAPAEAHDLMSRHHGAPARGEGGRPRRSQPTVVDRFTPVQNAAADALARVAAQRIARLSAERIAVRQEVERAKRRQAAADAVAPSVSEKPAGSSAGAPALRSLPRGRAR